MTEAPLAETRIITINVPHPSGNLQKRCLKEIAKGTVDFHLLEQDLALTTQEKHPEIITRLNEAERHLQVLFDLANESGITPSAREVEEQAIMGADRARRFRAEGLPFSILLEYLRTPACQPQGLDYI